MAERSLFDTVTQREVPREAPSLFEGVTVGMDELNESRRFDLGPDSSYGDTGYGESRHDWGIKSDDLYTLPERRAARQTVGEQFGSFLNQAIVGEIAGGMIEGTGYLLDLQSYGKLLNGTETEFGNWFSDFGKKMRTWSEEATPIYIDPDQNKFAPNHWSWWMQNGKSVASTLSLMIPAAGAVRGIGMAGKALGLAQKLSPMAKWAMTGLAQATISRHMEGMMEASGVQKEMYQKGLDKGMSPKEAEQYAATAAARTYGADWAMLLQDIPQYLLLNKAFGKASVGLAEESIGAAVKMGHKLAPVIGSKAAAIGWDMLGEGFEEAYQFVAAEEGKYLAEKIRDPKSESSFDGRLNKYIKDGEFWTSAVMGALGAGVMQTAGKAINDLIQGGDPQVRFLKEFGTKIAHAAGQVRFADLIGSESGKRAGIVNLETAMFGKAAESGGMNNAKELIKRSTDMTEEEAIEFDITPEILDVMRTNKDEILKHAEEYEKRWEDNAKKYDPRKVSMVTNEEFLISNFNEYKKDYKSRLAALKDNITNFEDLSYEAQNIFSISSEIASNNKGIAYQKKRLENTKNPLSKNEVDQANKIIARYEASNKIKEKDLQSQDESRDEETRKADDAVNIGGPHDLRDVKDDKDITGHPILEYKKLSDALVFADTTLKESQDRLDKILKDKKQPKPEPLDKETLSRIPESDDYVTYTADGKELTGIVDYIDEDGDYHIIPTVKYAPEAKYATKPEGEAVVIPSDKVKLDSKQYAEEDINDESLSDETPTTITYEEDTSMQYLNVSYMHDEGGKTPVVDNEELNKYLSDPATNLEGVEAQMFIDTTSEYAIKFFKDKGLTDIEIRKIQNGNLTDNDINTLQARVGWDNIPIGVNLVKDGKLVVHTGGMYYHTADFVSSKSTRDARYLADQKQQIRKQRFKIVPELLKGNDVYADTLRRGNGHYDNSEKRGNVLERHGLPVGDAKIAVSRKNGKIYTNGATIVAGITASTPGNVFANTKKTLDGREGWAKVNPVKLTAEHAEILWDAIMTRYSKGGGKMHPFPDDRVTGLTVGEVILMLTLFGEKKTNIDHKEFQGDKREDLRNKAFYVHSSHDLTFGTTTINMYEDNIEKSKQDKKDFIEWATKNKNYSMPISIAPLGVQMNQPLKRTFKIGKWESKADSNLTLAQFLMSVPVDGDKKFAVESDFLGFTRPSLMLGDNANAIKTRVPVGKKPKVPKATKESKDRVKTTVKVKKAQSIDSPIDLVNLPAGAQLYFMSPIVKEGKISTDLEKIVFATVIQDNKLGRVLDLNSFQSDYVSKTFGQWLLLEHEESFKLADSFVTYLKGRPHIPKVLVDTSTIIEEVVELPPRIQDTSEKVKEYLTSKQNENGTITVYRGVKKGGEKGTGQFWTTDKTVADWYAGDGGVTNSRDITLAEATKHFMSTEGKPGRAFGSDIFSLPVITESTETVEDITDIFNIPGTPMLADFSSPVTSIIDLPKELAWFHDRFGKQNVQLSSKLLTLAADGRQAFSIFTSDCIYLYTNAPAGATYHEAFHRVLLGYLSEEDRQQIYKSARKQYGELSDNELSERMAEEFRSYMNSGAKPKSRTIWQLFKDLFEFIRTYFTGETRLNSYEIDKLYDSINRSQFKYSKITAENRKILSGVETPMAVDIHRKTINFIDNYHDLDKIVKFLTAVLIQTNDINNLNDIGNIKMAKVYDYVEVMIKRMESAVINTQKQLDEHNSGKVIIPADELERKKDLQQMFTNSINVFKGVISKEFSPLFSDKVRDMLLKLNVRTIRDEDNALDAAFVDTYRGAWDRKESFQINSKDNILASVKFLIATLPLTGQLDPNIGISEFVDFNDMWNSLMHNLYDINDIPEMMERLEQYNDKYPYQKLIEKLNADTSGIKKQQLRTAVQKHKHDFVNFLLTVSRGNERTGEVEGVPTFEIRNADVTSASVTALRTWNTFFYGSKKAFTVKSTGLVIEKAYLDSIYKEYKDLGDRIEKEYVKNKEVFVDRQKVISEFVALLNKVGIRVDNLAFEEYLANRPSANTDDALFQSIRGDFQYMFNSIVNVDNKTARSIYSDEKYVKKLAAAYVTTHPELINDMVLGPGGNQYFVYSQNSYVTDIARRIRTDKTYLEEHLNKIYNDNSYYGQQLLADDKLREEFKILTFSMFGERGDVGSDYLSINPIEDYIFKMTAMANGLIPFPTMADRGTYYLLKGVQPFKFNYSVNTDGTHTMPSEAITILLGYAKSERRRIAEAKLLIDEYKAVEDSDNTEGQFNKEELLKSLKKNLVEDYHYKIKGGKMLMDEENASALQYHNFPEFNRKEKRDSEGNIIQTAFNFDAEAEAAVRSSITANIREELDYAESLGIIGSTTNLVTNKKQYYNRLLDANLIKENIANYGSQDIAIKNIIAGFFVNTVIANNEVEKLFSGDPAYYKPDKVTGKVHENRVKRLSAMTSSGDNFADKFEEAGLTDSTFNISTIATQKLPSINYEALEKYHKELQKRRLKQLYPNMDEVELNSEVTSLVSDILKGYRDMDPTDGQSWISPAMYKSLSNRLGEWSPEKDEAFEILQSGRELTPDDEKKVLKVTFQPLKLVYFNLVHDGNLAIPTYHKASFATIFRTIGEGKFGNRQIIDMLDRMEAKGKYEGLQKVDMFMMDSATKVGNRSKVEILDSKFEKFNDLSNLDIYQQPFFGLRRQLMTDTHDVDKTKTGSQFIKVVLGNLFLDQDVYTINGVKKNGTYIRDTAFKALTTLSDRGRKRIEAKLGYENGKVDKKKLVALLSEDAKKSNAADNLVDAIAMMGDDNFYLELDSLTEHKWIQSRIISLISKATVDVELPGNHLIQFANFGMRSIKPDYTFDEKLSDKDKHINWVKNATDDLQWVTLDDGKVVPMGCIVSINLFKHIIPNYDSISYKEKLKYLDENPEILGYRVPTQGQNSTFMFKVAGIYPETIGDVITLPTEFTTLTGSDFDIDKIYALRYNYDANEDTKKLTKIKFFEGDTNDDEFLKKIYKDRYGHLLRRWKFLNKGTEEKENAFTDIERRILTEMKESTEDDRLIDIIDKLLDYNFRTTEWWNEINAILKHYNQDEFVKENKGKDIFEVNSNKAVQNKLIDVFFAILRSEAHFLHTSAPLGTLTDRLKKKASDMRVAMDKDRINMYYQSPRFNETVKSTYNGGKDGIGPFALNNVHHTLAQLAGLEMKGTFGEVMYNHNGNIDLTQMYGKDKILISNWFSALIDAHVDVAKDPYIMDLNVNSITYNVLALLIRGGAGESAFDFLAQPILRELANEMLLSGKDNVLKKTYREEQPGASELEGGKIIELTAEEYVTKKWQSKLNKEELASVSGDLPSAFGDKLNKDLFATDTEDKAFIKRQLLVLKAFKELKDKGVLLNTLVQASQVDTKKFGSNVTELRIFINKIRKAYADNAFVNLEKILPYNPNTGEVLQSEGANHLGTYAANAIKFSLDVMGDISIYATPVFEALFDKLVMYTGNEYTTDPKFVNMLSDEIFSAMVSKFFVNPKTVAINANQLKVLITDAVPKTLIEIKDNVDGKYDDLKDNAFIKYLNLIPTTDDIIKDIVPLFVSVPVKNTKDKTDKDNMINSFTELLKHKDTMVNNLARRLFYYAYFTSGYRSRIYSFFNLLPNEMYRELVIKDPNDPKKLITLNQDDSYNGVIKKLLTDTKDLMNYLSYNSIEEEVLVNNHDNNNLIKPIKANGIAGTVIEYKGVTYTRPIAISIKPKVAKWLLLGYNSANEPIYRPYIKIRDEELGHAIYRYIGVTDTTPVYVLQNMRSYNARGIVIKEFGMGKSIIDAYNNLEVLKTEEDHINGTRGLGMEGRDFTYVPKVEQIVISKLPIREGAKESGDIEQVKTMEYKWARYSDNNYEVSTQGDKRFSALVAKLSDGRTIEEHYQVDIKGHPSISAGKGKAPIRNISREQSWLEYKALWERYFNENPELLSELSELAKGRTLTDKFASTPVSQARAIAEILNERYVKLNTQDNGMQEGETETKEVINPASDRYYQRSIQMKEDIRIGNSLYNINELLKIAAIFDYEKYSNNLISVEKSAAAQKEFESFILGDYFDESEVTVPEYNWIMANKELAKELFEDWYLVDMEGIGGLLSDFINEEINKEYDNIFKIIDIRQLTLFPKATTISQKEEEEQIKFCIDGGN